MRVAGSCRKSATPSVEGCAQPGQIRGWCATRAPGGGRLVAGRGKEMADKWTVGNATESYLGGGGGTRLSSRRAANKAFFWGGEGRGD